MIQFFTFAATLITTTTLWAADFEGATEFESYNIRGRYTVTCVTGKVRHKVHFCKAHGMHPFGWARFSHVPNEKVTRVALKATDEKGNTISRNSSWDRELNQSFKQFNLFKDGFFFTPLIREGENQVEWELTNGKKVVDHGSFTATVVRGNHLQCAPLKETKLLDAKYCKEDGLEACARYFEKQKDCVPLED